MNYLAIYRASLADGEGWRTVLFVSGCHHHCKGCQNPESWNPNAGHPFTKEVKDYLFNCITDEISGLTISGGDPLYKRNVEDVTKLCKEFKDTKKDGVNIIDENKNLAEITNGYLQIAF